MGSAHGLVGRVSWTHFWGTMSDEDVSTYCSHHLAALDGARQSGEALVGLVFHYQARAPDAGQRKVMAELIRDHSDALGQYMNAFVYCFDSTLARGAVTAVSWLVKKPFKEKVFGKPNDALAVLSHYLGPVDVEAVWRDVASKVPENQLYPR